MSTLDLDRWLSRIDTSRKGGGEGGLHTRKDKKSLRIVRVGLDVDFEIYSRGGTGDVEENHHVLEAFVVLGDVIKLK